MTQNTSHAVMAQRTESADSLDDFPTPPWATRAFLDCAGINGDSVWEPACNRGHMSRVLGEYFAQVYSSDIFDYGAGSVQDFLEYETSEPIADWVITNPPFKAAEQFYHKARSVARIGVALLTRTVFIESVGRYERLFRDHPPLAFYQYVERVPMVKGRLDAKVSTATGYGWLLWRFDQPGLEETVLRWIPPSRKQFERSEDYG